MPRVVIKVSEGHYDKVSDVVEALSDMGFVPSEVLQEIGVIIGDYRGEAIGKLESVPGVSVVVEDQKEFRPSESKNGNKSGNEDASDHAGARSSTLRPRGSSDSAKKKVRELIDACTRFDR